MQFPSEKELQALREKYPAGTLIRLNHMDDPYNPIPPGTVGEVTFIDYGGNILMKWQNGRSLALIDGVDDFEVISDRIGGSEK